MLKHRRFRKRLLETLWSGSISGTDSEWVDRVAELEQKDEPLGDYGPIVRRMLDAGVQRNDIARFARIVGYEAVFGCLYDLDEAGISEVPGHFAGGLYESLLSADPTGTEMRPPK